MTEQLEGQMSIEEVFGPDIWCGKTCPEPLVQTKVKTLELSFEETSKVADETAIIPGPPKGKWAPAGCIMGDGWSIAWRVHDAQFWGVPQRRKRISLVADFGGETAPEILFERKSVSRDFEESRKPGKALPPMLDQALRRQAVQ